MLFSCPVLGRIVRTEFVHLFLHQCKLAVNNDTMFTNCTGKWDVTLTPTHIDERESISGEEPVKKEEEKKKKKSAVLSSFN